MSQNMTVAQIKEVLDSFGIEYDKRLRKKDLLEIMNKETYENVSSKPKTYVVIHDFKDLEDKNKVYCAGETFPKPANKKISKERIDELSSKNNKIGKVLIKETD